MSADLQGLKKWPQGFYFRKYAAWWYIFKQIFLWNDYTDTYLKNRDPKFTTFFSLWCFAGILLYLNNSCVWSVWRYFLSAHPGRGCMDNLSPVTVTRPISICAMTLVLNVHQKSPVSVGLTVSMARESSLWYGHTACFSAALSCYVSLQVPLSQVRVILYDFTIRNKKKMTGIQKNDDSNGL